MNPVHTRLYRIATLSVLVTGALCAEVPQGSHPAQPPLDARVQSFDVTDAIFRDAVSELSLKKVEGLHLGFEEIIRDRIQQDPRSISPHFAIHLENKTIRDILDEICRVDSRYTWSQDGMTINIYPRESVGLADYLLNLKITRLSLDKVPDPGQAVTSLSKEFPDEQVGYYGPGLGSYTYAQPWTVTFESLTVRQFINRIAEHVGPQTSWVWEGGRKEMGFTFLKSGFNTQRPPEPKKNH
jgi:hypothetical protein